MITMSGGPLLQPLIACLLVAYSGESAHTFEGYPLAAFRAALAVIPICLALASILAWNLREKDQISLSGWLRQQCLLYKARR